MTQEQIDKEISVIQSENAHISEVTLQLEKHSPNPFDNFDL
jgi:hypothetical protein